MKLRSLNKAAVAGLTVILARCVTNSGQSGALQQAFNNTFNHPDPCANNARNAGMALGGIAGAKTGDRGTANTLVGAVVGTTVGGLAGANIDKRRCALAEVAHQYQLRVTFAAGKSGGSVLRESELQSADAAHARQNAIGNNVSLQDESVDDGHFKSNSDELTSRAEPYFSAIADIYNQDKAAGDLADPRQRQESMRAGARRKLRLVGHTDDVGQSRSNAQLSERRARTVALYLAAPGCTWSMPDLSPLMRAGRTSTATRKPCGPCRFSGTGIFRSPALPSWNSASRL